MMKRVRLVRQWLKHSRGDLISVSEDQARWLEKKTHKGGQIGVIEGDLHGPDNTENAANNKSEERGVLPRHRQGKTKRGRGRPKMQTERV